MTHVFSIGYGNRKVEELLSAIQAFGIRYLLDIRSSPHSKFSPEFNREPLMRACADAGIRYVFIGDQLGGRPPGDRCYDEQGKVVYSRLEAEPFFIEGLKRLETALAKNIDVVLMCSELRPEQCHRSKLIGEALRKRGICVRHIDADGNTVEQGTVIARLTGGQKDFFGENADVTRSRGVYRRGSSND